MQRRLILTAPLWLAGCGSLLPAQKYVPQVNWPLQPAPPANNPPNPHGPILLVRDLAAGPGLNQQGLQTLQPDGSLDIAYYNRWAVEPADAATAALTAWAEASGAFSAVVNTGTRLTAQLIVEGEFTEFVADPAAGQARAVLTLVVIANNPGLTAKPHPLAQQRITGTAPLHSNDAAAEVAALQAALANALVQAVSLVVRFA
ncbi:MAG: ABC-type transport auxiliary lipoprotein family protein [Acidocella sp.]|nr:ABC-type transport auxiliary lipoprotein family protein [Acidocella sp.]